MNDGPQIPNSFPEYWQPVVKGPCSEGHLYTECGVPITVCPVCRRHGDLEKKLTKGNKGMNR